MQATICSFSVRTASAFCGAIDIPGHGRLTSVFSDTRADRGEHVGLRLDPRGCQLFSAGPAAPAPPAPASLQPAAAAARAPAKP